MARQTGITAKMALWLSILCAAMLTARGQAPDGYWAATAAYLDGACELPPNGSVYSGQADLSYFMSNSIPQTNAGVICRVYLSSSFAALHAGIFGPATAPQAGPVLFDLGQPGYITNIFALVSWGTTEYFTNVDFGFSSTLSMTTQQMNDLLAGLLYVNVTSAAYPGGEIRGQITSQPVLSQPALQPGSACAFDVTGPPEGTYEAQFSTDLLNWTTFTNFNTSTNIVFHIVDAEATSARARFYRVRTPPSTTTNGYVSF